MAECQSCEEREGTVRVTTRRWSPMVDYPVLCDDCQSAADDAHAERMISAWEDRRQENAL